MIQYKKMSEEVESFMSTRQYSSEEEEEEYSSSEEEEVFSEEEEEESWGGKRDDFYGDDSDDEDDSDQEDEEAIRLQKAQISKTKMEDYGTSEEEDSSSEEEEEELDFREIGEEKEEKETVEVGKVKTLSEEFKKVSNELSTLIHPIYMALKEGDMLGKGLDDGLSVGRYVEMKFHLLLTYCVQLMFYLHKKANGESVRDHEVIGRLLEIRTILETLRPVEERLRGQIEKLAAMAKEDQGEEEEKKVMGLKPSLGQFMMEEDESSDSEDMEENNLFRVKKTAAVKFNEEERAADRLQKQRTRLEEASKRNALLQDMEDEITGAPERDYEDDITLTAQEKEIEKIQQEREAFEEEHFVRLTESKDLKKVF